MDGDAVFEDLEPRVAAIGGRERIVLVKSYLKRGSALVVIDPVSTAIVAETPPIGHAYAWAQPGRHRRFRRRWHHGYRACPPASCRRDSRNVVVAA